MNVEETKFIRSDDWGKLLETSSFSVSHSKSHYRQYIVVKNGKYQLAVHSQMDAQTRKVSLEEITQVSKRCIEQTKASPVELAIVGKQITDCTTVLIDMRMKKWDSYKIGRGFLMALAILTIPFVVGIFLVRHLKKEEFLFIMHINKLRKEINDLKPEINSSKERAMQQLPSEINQLEGWSDDEKLKLQTFRNLALNQVMDIELVRSGIENQINENAEKSFSLVEGIRGKSTHKNTFNDQFYKDVARNYSFLRKDSYLNIADSKAVPAQTTIQVIDKNGNYSKEDVSRVTRYLTQEELDQIDSKNYAEVVKAQRVLDGAGYIEQLIQKQDASCWESILQFVITQVTKADIILSSTLLFGQVDLMGLRKLDPVSKEEYNLGIDIYQESPTKLEIIRDGTTKKIIKVNVITDGYLAVLKKFQSGEPVPLLPEALKFHTQFSVTLGENNKAVVSDPVFDFDWAKLAATGPAA